MKGRGRMIGLLVLVASPVLIPLAIWVDYTRWIKRRPPGASLELTKASHGAGMLWLSIMILVVMNAQGVPVASPVLWVPLGVMALWGALWLVTSGWTVRLYGSQGPQDVIVLVRAGIKIAVSAAILHFLPFDMQQLIVVASRATDWLLLAALALIAGWFAAMWCLATGITKFLLVLIARIPRGRKAPPAVENPRGGARDATRAEARQAMRGKGGTASALDRKEF